MTVSICIGSSCHLKGSREIIQMLQSLVAQNHLENKVDLTGSFCTGNCVKGVCVSIDGKLHSVKPDTAEIFFLEEILSKVQ